MRKIVGKKPPSSGCPRGGHDPNSRGSPAVKRSHATSDVPLQNEATEIDGTDGGRKDRPAAGAGPRVGQRSRVAQLR